MSLPLLTLRLEGEGDLVAVRQRTRQLSEVLGFDVHDQTRIATALSEIARNAIQYARHGQVRFAVEGRTPPQLLTIVVSDRGPGIPHLERVLAGEYQSPTGLGMGIAGARRLVDQFSIDSRPDGLHVVLRKVLPRQAPLLGRADIPAITERLAAFRTDGPLVELQRQNQELASALWALRARQEELVRLNQELEDTNRGVVALFAELDEKADHLRRADEMKSRFLSNMSHEFRTPLNAVRGLANLLLQRVDGDLTPEQEHQVTLIANAAGDLSELVDDLLDIAKVEAGKTVVRPVEFEVRNMFGALRGMLRPMLLSTQTSVVFEEANGLPVLYTDEGKVSQILRNFISNALKYTEHGEVRITARMSGDDTIALAVSDTGIGIASEDQERVFHEFVQLESPLQRSAKGTGLGLPLSRRLADLLGGRITVESELGRGSTFTLEIPVRYEERAADALEESQPPEVPGRLPVLVVEDSPEMVLLYRKYLENLPFEIVHASTLAKAQRALRRRPVRAMILDILLGGEDSWTFLAERKADPVTAGVPIVVVTQVDDRQKTLALGADEFLRKPPDRRTLVGALHRALARVAGRRGLIIDDEEASRYLLRKLLLELGWDVLEADGGRRGLELAAAARPDAILLDLKMPDLDGFAVLSQLRASGATRGIPVVVVTSKVLAPEEDERLREMAEGVLSKSLSRGESFDQLGRLLLATMLPEGARSPQPRASGLEP